MRRRRLLATLTTGALATAAGCGYAYGGGDVRDAGSVGTPGFGETRYALDDQRITVARSGQLFWHGDGGSTFDEGTSVTVADRVGERLWTYEHRARSVAVAGTEPVYLLDDQRRLVSIDVAPTDDGSSGQRGRPFDGEERWRVGIEGARAPLAAGRRGAYVAVDGGVAAVRNGGEAWRVELPDVVESLVVADGTLVAGTADAVVGIAPSGTERWRQSTDGVARFATAAGCVVVYDGSRLTARRLATGERLWSIPAELPGGLPTMTADRVYVVAPSAVRTVDADTGDTVWRGGGASRLRPPVVPAPEGVYAARGRCEALALGRNGVRWTRELSVRSCELVGGWLDGEAVAFLFESGDLRWLQRTDQDPGLL